jgi:excisionase family DNA binding protein
MQVDTRRRELSVAEFAAVLRVSTLTVYRLIETRELEATRVDRSYRVRAVDVDRLVHARYANAV